MKQFLHQLKNSHFWTDCENINDQLALLNKHFSINYFDYARIFFDNTCLFYFNNSDYVDCFISNDRYQPPTAYLQPGKYLWTNYIQAEFLQIASQSFNFVHGLTVINQYPDYLEIYNFSAPSHCAEVVDLYLNHSDVLDQFIIQFIDKMKINSLHTRKRLILPTLENTDQPLIFNHFNHEEQIHAFINDLKKSYKIRKNNKTITINGRMISLSHREVDCLILLANGLNNKEIARELNISFRTVEGYFSKLLEKTQVKSRTQLLSAYKFK